MKVALIRVSEFYDWENTKIVFDVVNSCDSVVWHDVDKEELKILKDYCKQYGLMVLEYQDDPEENDSFESVMRRAKEEHRKKEEAALKRKQAREKAARERKRKKEKTEKEKRLAEYEKLKEEFGNE